MKRTSLQIFHDHFSIQSLSELIDTHLSPATARGVDGIGYDNFIASKDSELRLISARALSGSYKFSPYRQKLILKDAKSPPRQVSIPTIRDRLALRALNNFLCDIFSDRRPQHSHPIVSSVKASLNQWTGDGALVKLDITKYYDTINHKILIGALKKRIRSSEPVALIEAAIRTPTGSVGGSNVLNTLGVPQGLSISNILASIYLGSIDSKYGSALGIKYHRYVDDILCITPATEASIILESITKDLRKYRRLNVHPLGQGKTDIKDIADGVDYLGYTFQGQFISVRGSSKRKFLTSIIRIIRGATPANFAGSIWRLNLRITGCRLNGANVGWMFYFSQINDTKLIQRIDAKIRQEVKRRFGTSGYAACKKLIKTYHEVNYNYNTSSYFPDFDSFDRKSMLSVIAQLNPGLANDLAVKSDNQVRYAFRKLISKEVREMEKDTLGSFS